MRAVDRVDAYQRRHRWLGLPLAVVYKLFDDRGPYLAALVTYYAFVSLFPLLLLFFSSLGFFLEGHPGVREQLETSAVANFPLIGSQLQKNISGFHGSGAALVVGIIGTLYGGLGAMQAAQAAFNQIYGVPRNEQPNPFKSRVRSLGLLALLGTGVLLSTAVATLVGTGNSVSHQLGVGLRIAGYLLSFGINVALFTGAFQLLTARELRVRHVITGGLIAGGSWEVLQTVGSGYVAGRLGHDHSLYGTFGAVLAALAWIYLQSLILMVSAEINVVVHHGLWPRALLTPFTDNVELTEADQRAYSMYVDTQRFKGFERVSADFSRSYPEGAAAPPGPDPAVTGVTRDDG